MYTIWSLPIPFPLLRTVDVGSWEFLDGIFLALNNARLCWIWFLINFAFVDKFLFYKFVWCLSVYSQKWVYFIKFYPYSTICVAYWVLQSIVLTLYIAVGTQAYCIIIIMALLWLLSRVINSHPSIGYWTINIKNIYLIRYFSVIE